MASKARHQAHQAFLERDFIYHSPAFRHQHEAAARENLAALLAELRP